MCWRIVSRTARDYRDGVEFDPEELERGQERMAALQGLMRAYGPRMADVLAARDEAADLVSLVDDAEERERVAQRAVDAAERALAAAARTLDGARGEAAPRFSQAVSAQMQRLEMGTAQLVCEQRALPRASWTRSGASEVEFMFQPGAGMQARPLARIASGGEVSRVMLAIKVVLGQADSVDTLVFDEVDAGVGGSVAVALAEVLADLARSHQVIVVTHLAQVAVHGDVHYAVTKIARRRRDAPDLSATAVRRRAARRDRPYALRRCHGGIACPCARDARRREGRARGIRNGALAPWSLVVSDRGFPGCQMEIAQLEGRRLSRRPFGLWEGNRACGA